MKILSILFITFLVVFAVGCNEMQNQVMKPITMPDDEGPAEDSTVTSVGDMKDPSTETAGTKDDTPPETEPMDDETTDESEETMEDETEETIVEPSDETEETMDVETSNEHQTPDAAFVSATFTDGTTISENASITITFDNDPGEVTVSDGSVSGSGTSWTISGPFSVGSLSLTISWTNGSGSKTLNYTVEAETPDAAFVSATYTDGTTISENDSITITFDNDPGNVSASSGTVSGSGTTWTISGPFPVGSLMLTISWTNGSGSKTLNYTVEADTPDPVIVEDTTSPEVSTSSTANGATDVDPATVTQSGITITFSESISSQTLKLLKGSTDVGWTVTISGNTITLTKGTGSDLEHGTAYTISGTVRDGAGNETTVSITFTTKDAPVQESLGRGEGLRIGVTAPTFSIPDSDGNTFNLSDSIGSTNIVIVFYRYRH